MWIQQQPGDEAWIGYVGEIIRNCGPYVGEGFLDHPDQAEILQELEDKTITRDQAKGKLNRFLVGTACTTSQFVQLNRSDWRDVAKEVPGVDFCLTQGLGFKMIWL